MRVSFTSLNGCIEFVVSMCGVSNRCFCCIHWFHFHREINFCFKQPAIVAVCLNSSPSLNLLIQFGAPISRVVECFLDSYLISMIPCCPKIIARLHSENSRLNFLLQLEPNFYRLVLAIYFAFSTPNSIPPTCNLGG